MNKSMTNFKCVRCGFSSLVRSNFRLTTDRVPTCRNVEACEKRIKKKTFRDVEKGALEDSDLGRGAL